MAKNIIVRPIHTHQDLDRALAEVEELMALDPEPGSEAGDKLDVLVTLIESYEQKHFPIDFPDAIAAIDFRMDQSGLNPKDLVPMIGALNRVYEVLNRTRPLSLRMIRNLHTKLGIPAEALIH